MSASSSKVNATRKDSIGRRLIKFLRIGNSDVQETFEVASFGVDSAPLKNQIAIYLETGRKGKPVIIGYLNKDQKAAAGEMRIFSKNSSGQEKASIWLKASGEIKIVTMDGATEKATIKINNSGVIEVDGDSIEILGSANHAAQFEALKTGFDSLVADFNSHLSSFNAHTHATAATGPPVPPTPGPGIPATPSTASVDSAKLDDIKVP